MTGTELLIAVMERFRDYGEATDMIVVFADEHGKVRLKTNCTATRSLGLACYAVADLEDMIVQSREEESPDAN
jgi:hypothetical protein